MKSPERWTLMALNLKQRTWVTTTTVHFRIGHVQANPFETGCIMFCHETGGFATQRTWLIRDGEAAPRPMYKAPHDYWVTHESWWKKNEIIFTVWPFDATHKRLPHGIFSALAESGEAKEYARYPAWHTHASPDGRWIVGDDFQRNIWLIRADSRQRRLLSHGHLSDGHKTHPHPSFTPDSQSVVFNSSRDGHPDIFMIAIPSDLENLPKP